MTDDLLMGKVMSNSHCRIDAQLSNMCLIDCISKQNFLCKIDFLPEYTDFLLVFLEFFSIVNPDFMVNLYLFSTKIKFCRFAIHFTAGYMHKNRIFRC